MPFLSQGLPDPRLIKVRRREHESALRAQEQMAEEIIMVGLVEDLW